MDAWTHGQEYRGLLKRDFRRTCCLSFLQGVGGGGGRGGRGIQVS